jgi:cyclic nucleotide gated channel
MPLQQKQTAFAAGKLGVASSGKNKIFVGGDVQHSKIFDPSSDFILTWNRIFLFSCFLALFIDPLYFYVPKIVYGNPYSCVGTDRHLTIIITFLRSIADLLYVIHIIMKFRTAFINPGSNNRVFGRGDLVTDPKEIAWKYLRSDFAVDVVAALPLPQVTL